MKKKVVFLDRDGVINREVNYLHKVEDFVFTPYCIEALKTFSSKGFELVVVTNQAGIAKGYFSLEDYQKLTDYYVNLLGKYGISFLSVQYCPHHPEGVIPEFSIACECRKPKPGMILDVLNKFDIDLDQSVIVGDKKSDLVAGQNAGVGRGYMVETGHDLSKSDYEMFTVLPNLFEVAKVV